MWLDSQLTLKEHYPRRLKDGTNALTRLRRLAGHCGKVMTACIQSVAMFGAELWWNGTNATGTIGRGNELQRLVNQQARAVTGCFRTTRECWQWSRVETGSGATREPAATLRPEAS